MAGWRANSMRLPVSRSLAGPASSPASRLPLVCAELESSGVPVGRLAGDGAGSGNPDNEEQLSPKANLVIDLFTDQLLA